MKRKDKGGKRKAVGSGLDNTGSKNNENKKDICRAAVNGKACVSFENIGPAPELVSLREPPLTPNSAINYAIIISNAYSSEPEKRKISHKAIRRIEAFEKRCDDDTAWSFVQNAWPVVVSSGLAIGKSAESLKDSLAQAETLKKSKIRDIEYKMNSNISHYDKIRNMRLENLGKSRIVGKVPSIAVWLTSIGVSAIAVYKLEQEIVSFIANHYPKLQDLKYATYCVAASLLVGAAMGARKLINMMIGWRQEKTANKFHEKKSAEVSRFEHKKAEIEAEFERLKSRIEKKHLEDSVRIAGNAYAEVYRLCEECYPEYINKNPNYRQFQEIRKGRSEDEAYEFLVDIGKREARAQFAKMGPIWDFQISCTYQPKEEVRTVA